MVKTFKKIAALALALALVVCFAVSASAVTVTTTTQYVSTSDTSDTSNVKVSVTVQGDEIENKEVTYYAYSGDTPVFIDQTTAAGKKAAFSFQTTADKLTSLVKVGYTNADGAAEAKIDGYAVEVVNGTADKTVIPNGEETVAVNVTYTPSATGKVYKDVTVDGAAGNAIENDGVITVTLSNFDENADTVTITVNEKDESSSTPATATNLDAGYVKDAEAGTRTITVLGIAKDAYEGKFGVIITTKTIETSYETEDLFNEAFTENEDYFAAKIDPGTNGVFAVQVVDNGDEGNEFFEADTYNTAIYAKSYDGSYKIAAVETITVG